MNRLDEIKKEAKEILKNKKSINSKTIEVQYLIDEAFELGYTNAMICYGLKDEEESN